MQQTILKKPGQKVRLEHVSKPGKSASDSEGLAEGADPKVPATTLKTADCRGIDCHPTLLIPYPKNQPLKNPEKGAEATPQPREPSKTLMPQPVEAAPAACPQPIQSPPKATKQPKKKTRQSTAELAPAQEVADTLFLKNLKTQFLEVASHNQSLMGRLSESREKLVKLTSEKEKMRALATNSDERAYNLERENQELRAKVQRLEAMVASLSNEAVQTQLRAANDHFLVTENAHLRADNDRLFSMLRETAEYQKLAKSSDPTNRLRSVNPPLNETPLPVQPKTSREPSPPNDMLWAPERSFQFLRALNKCPGFSLPEPSVDLIVYELNKIWRTRELYILDKCHAFCKNCKNKNLLGVSEAARSGPDGAEVRRLERELVQAKARLKSAQKLTLNAQRGPFTVEENRDLARNLRLLSQKNGPRC